MAPLNPAIEQRVEREDWRENSLKKIQRPASLMNSRSFSSLDQRSPRWIRQPGLLRDHRSFACPAVWLSGLHRVRQHALGESLFHATESLTNLCR